MTGSRRPRSAGPVAALCLLLGLGAARTEAAVIEVPRQERSLPAAVFRAGYGDTVRVAPGRYLGPVFLKSGVRLEAAAGPGVTEITLPAARDSVETRAVVLAVGGAPGTALIGFAIRGGRYGIEAGKTVLQLYDCRLAGSTGAGLHCGEGSLVRAFTTVFDALPVGVQAAPGADLLLMHDTFSGDGEGLRVEAAGVRAFRNTFTGNETAVRVLPTGTANLGGALREANDFLDNRRAVVNESPAAVSARFNWWGSAECDSVRAGFTGPVEFLPFSDAGHRDSVAVCP